MKTLTDNPLPHEGIPIREEFETGGFWREAAKKKLEKAQSIIVFRKLAHWTLQEDCSFATIDLVFKELERFQGEKGYASCKEQLEKIESNLDKKAKYDRPYYIYRMLIQTLPPYKR